ncbi:hypothetical protein [Blastococcus montanus]|uniref:hypothetical protein n=1 Tax=Blastococcus montanus TaxID=3144973 RepID=UPI00320824C9
MPGELVAVVAPMLGCLGLIALIVVLGASSTARYEFERNHVPARQLHEAPPERTEAPMGAAGRPAGGGEGRERSAPERTAVGLATHPAGRRLADGPAATAWWLVDELEGTALAGPFADSLEADWAAVSGSGLDSARAVYGVRRPDGSVVRRQSPQERSWLAELGHQLDRLPEDWDPYVSDDDDALTTLAVEVTAAVLEAGLALHDCDGPDGAGGVCLTPHPAGLGVVVTWRQHDRMSLQQVRGAAADAAVQRTMTTAVVTVLRQLGFPVEEVGSTGAHLVTTSPR